MTGATEGGDVMDGERPVVGHAASHGEPWKGVPLRSVPTSTEALAAAYARGVAAGWHECCDAWEDFEGECPEEFRSRYPRPDKKGKT